jgi:hypothetical protein
MNKPLLRKRYTPYIISLLLFVFFGNQASSYAGNPGTPRSSGVPRVSDRMYFTPACPIIAQNFNNAADVNGATSDPSATGWYLDASHVPNAVYFSVKSHRLKAQTLGGEGVWYSQVFPISGYTDVQIDAKVSNEGSKSSSEYVKICHKLDGGPEILDTVMYGDMGSPLIKSKKMTGNNVQIVIHIYDTTRGNSEYYIEQYDVFKEVGPCSVTTIPVTASASNSGILTCNYPSTTLSASTTATGTTTYSWTGPNGFNTSIPNPVVSTAGTYTVTATNAAGTGSTTVTVTANNSAPDLTATGTALGCGTSAVITASSSVSGVTYSWTGPGTFNSNSSSPTVSAAGTYTVTVRNPATGCTASQSVTVTAGASPTVFWLEDFTFPNGTTSDTGPTYWTATTTGVGTYSVQNNEFKTSFTGQSVGTWTSGDINIAGKTSTVLNVYLRSETASSGDAFETADYVRVYYKLYGGSETLVYEDLAGIGTTTAGTKDTTITATIPTGSSVQVIIRTSNSDPTERYYFDNVKLTGVSGVDALASASGMLTCTHSSVALTGSSTTIGATFNWTGPNNFNSAAQNPTVSAAGIYTLTVTAGGCTASDTALVSQDVAVPAALTTTAVPVSALLTCTNNSVTFTAGSATPGVTYNWTGPGGAISSSTAVTVSAIGTYTVTATNPINGCSSSASSTVTQNIVAPGGVTTTADPATAQITCAHPTVLLTSSSTTAGVTYSWSGSSGVFATGPSATVNAAGVYTVTVTDPANGCVTTLPGTVTKNVSVPVGLSASPSDIISCFTPVIDLQGSSTTPGATFSWAGPDGFTATTAIAQTDKAGSYTLTVTNPANGCTASTGTIVTADTATPTGVTASNDGPLNCIKTSVTLTGGFSTATGDYLWVTPDNTFISGARTVITAPGVYTFVVTNDNNGCASQATTTVLQNTTGCPGATVLTPGSASSGGKQLQGASADELAGFDYKVYPNPFSTTALIEFTAPVSSLVTVELYNGYGYKEKSLFNKMVVSRQTYRLELGAAGLSSGAHFCVIRSNGKIYTTKLVLIK